MSTINIKQNISDEIKNNNVERVEYLIENNIDIDNSSFLLTACMNGSIDVVRYLLTTSNLKININEQNADGNTPFSYDLVL